MTHFNSEFFLPGLLLFLFYFVFRICSLLRDKLGLHDIDIIATFKRRVSIEVTKYYAPESVSPFVVTDQLLKVLVISGDSFLHILRHGADNFSQW